MAHDRFEVTVVSHAGTMTMGPEFTGFLFNEPADHAAPLIVNVTPADGAPIRSNEFWTADITLDGADGEVDRIIIWASYEGLQIVEVIYDGAAFTPLFNGKSTIEALEDGGYHVEVLRNTGWPGSPSIFIHASTTNGQVNV